MTVQALARVALIHPLGDMGDRQIQGLSTVIANEEWHIEADYHRGTIGDVTLYRNTCVHIKGAKATWEWYAAIPVANIKVYRLADAEQGPSVTPLVERASVPAAVASNAESKAKTQAPGTAASGSAAE